MKNSVATNNRLVTRIDGELYDLTEFAFRHPGGAAPIESMRGIDGTQVMLYAHLRDERVWQMLRAYKIKDEQQYKKAKARIPENHPEYELILKREQESIESGKSLCSWEFFILNHFAMISAFTLGIYISAVGGYLWPGAVMMAWAQYHNIAVGAHMAHHQSLFSTGAANRWYMRWFSFILSGYDSRTYFYAHAQHHAFTNMVDKDMGLQTGLVVWHPEHLFENHPEFLLRFQFLFWWPQGAFVAWLMVIATFANLFPFLANLSYINLSDNRKQISPSPLGAVLFMARNLSFVYFFGFPLFALSTTMQSLWGVFCGGSAHYDCEKIDAHNVSLFTPMGHLVGTSHNWMPQSSLVNFLTSYAPYHLTHHVYPTQSLEYGKQETETLKQDCATLGLPYPVEHSAVAAWLAPVISAYKNYHKLVKGKGVKSI